MSLRWNSNLLIPDLVGVLGFRVCGCNPCGDPPPPESIPFCDRVAFRAGPGGEVLGGDNALVATEGTTFALTVSRLPQCYRWHGTPAEFEAAAGYPAPVAEGEYYFDTAASSFWVVAEGVFEASAAPDWHGVGEIVVTWTVNRTECGCPHMVEAATGTLTWADGDVADKTITLAAPTHTGALPFWTCNGVGGGGEPFTVSLARVSSTSVGHGCGSTGVAANCFAVCTHPMPQPGQDPDLPYTDPIRYYYREGRFTPAPLFGAFDNTASVGYKRRTIKRWDSAGVQVYSEESAADDAGYYYTSKKWWGTLGSVPGGTITTQTATQLVIENGLARMEYTNSELVDAADVVADAMAAADAEYEFGNGLARPGGSGGSGVSYSTVAGTAPWDWEMTPSVEPDYQFEDGGASVVRYNGAATYNSMTGLWDWTEYRLGNATVDTRGCYYGHPNPTRYGVFTRTYTGTTPGGAHTLIDASACAEVTEDTYDVAEPAAAGRVDIAFCDPSSPSFPAPPAFVCYPGLAP